MNNHKLFRTWCPVSSPYPPAVARLPMSLPFPDLGREEMLLLVTQRCPSLLESQRSVQRKEVKLAGAPKTAESHLATQVHLDCARFTSWGNMISEGWG